MDTNRNKEAEFRDMMENYAQFMNIQVQKYNLLKYGLDPEDIMQDVKIRIWKLIRNEKNIVSPASYIKKIVSSAVIDQIRKCRRDDSLFHHEKLKRISELESSYSRDAIRKKAFEEAVGRAVEQLIASRRQVMKLYLLNLTIQEISSYLNWSQDKTRNLLYRGLADLRESLKDMEAQNENRH
jgi:RNA polymerase sigma-70 factor (ECF subfamily)